MISVEEARARILAGLRPTPPEIVALPAAWGRVTAAPLRAKRTQPPADVSAMDGYALRAADGSEGAVLRLAGSAPAGHPFGGRVGPGEVVRIFTGSVVPDGADAVVAQEDTEALDGAVRLREAARPGRHIRRAGQDFREGDELVSAGRRLGARDVGLAAAGDHPWVAVHRKPRIAILATGDEIAMPGEPVGPGGIVSSNSHALAALVRAGGGEPMLLPIARDEHDAVAAAADLLGGADMLATTGGASVGEHDLIQSGLSARGFRLDFWKIAMRPGKPLIFGDLRGVPVLGLPGNPVSALVCGILFLMPALARLSGLPGDPPASVPAVLGGPVSANDHRADHLRAALSTDSEGRLVATPYGRQDSSLLRLMAQAGGLVLRAPHAPALEAGAKVQVIRVDAAGL